MSADNAVIVGCFPNEFKVIHAQAIDNLGYEPDDEDGFNSREVISYFNNGKTFSHLEKALVYAHELADNTTFVEYGVQKIQFPHTFDQYQRRALLNRSR